MSSLLGHRSICYTSCSLDLNHIQLVAVLAWLNYIGQGGLSSEDLVSDRKVAPDDAQVLFSGTSGFDTLHGKKVLWTCLC